MLPKFVVFFLFVLFHFVLGCCIVFRVACYPYSSVIFTSVVFLVTCSLSTQRYVVLFLYFLIVIVYFFFLSFSFRPFSFPFSFSSALLSSFYYFVFFLFIVLLSFCLTLVRDFYLLVGVLVLLVLRVPCFISLMLFVTFYILSVYSRLCGLSFALFSICLCVVFVLLLYTYGS